MLKKSWKKKNTFKLKVSKIKEIKMTIVEIKQKIEKQNLKKINKSESVFFKKINKIVKT